MTVLSESRSDQSSVPQTPARAPDSHTFATPEPVRYKPSIRTTPVKGIKLRRRKLEIGVVVCFVFMVLSLAELSRLAPPSDSPVQPGFLRNDGTAVPSRSFLSTARKALSKCLLSLSSALDHDTVMEVTTSRGYLKKALDKAREDLHKQVDQQAELQHFYEGQVNTLTEQLEAEEATLNEVLGDDFDSSKATKTIAKKMSLLW
eukprot:CAMPEP_0117670226 /NCGR_PEP_ID=MMETSP0804-20121206/12619_1 /TAXON_ID=1074897 /ORGANISM="Tetraselmis astigmatica, Strain CCMP880" /LENGTH=202 /DNA_ID=CAMNT_0005478469 /DNA_START=219 /DNA_END=827 /DNA_ORIENTATION=+